MNASPLKAFGFLLFCFCGQFAVQLNAQQATTEVPLTILEAGPVHEAFGSAFQFDAAISERITLAPPPPIIEDSSAVPFDESDEAVWISGYWHFAADQETYIWIPGVWRYPPADSVWVYGNYVDVTGGVIRVPGYWRSAAFEDQDVPLYKQPPANVQRVPAASMLARGSFWVPGIWLPAENNKFGWREGFAAQKIPRRTFQPDYYIATPDGYIYVPPYWDHELTDRGQPFAAIAFPTLTDPQALAYSMRLNSEAMVPLEMTALESDPFGEIRYDTRLSKSKKAPPSSRNPDAEQTPLTAVDFAWTSQNSATISGVVAKGSLHPKGIEVRLLGSGIKPVVTDSQGRFTFKNVPYGAYYIRASGPVQNFIRRAAIQIDVEKSNVDLNLELK